MEIPVVHVNTQMIRVKWSKPEEDQSTGTVLETILVSVNSTEDQTAKTDRISPDQSEYIFNVEQNSTYTLTFQAIFENGLISDVSSKTIRSAPTIYKPYIENRGAKFVEIGWSKNDMVEEYQIYAIDKVILASDWSVQQALLDAVQQALFNWPIIQKLSTGSPIEVKVKNILVILVFLKD